MPHSVAWILWLSLDRIDLVGIDLNSSHFAMLPGEGSLLDPPLRCTIDFLDELNSIHTFDPSVV